jgi:hypothetical protein
MQDAEACAEFASPDAAALVVTWPPPKRPLLWPWAKALAPGAEAALRALYE